MTGVVWPPLGGVTGGLQFVVLLLSLHWASPTFAPYKDFILFGYTVPECPEMRCAEGSPNRCSQSQFSPAAKCQCDAQCSLFHDCCYDYHAICEGQSRPNALRLTAGQPNTASCATPAHFQYETNIWLVDTCPAGSDEYLRTKCSAIVENPSKEWDRFLISLPVASSRVTYKNIYCALCNDEPLASVSYWTLGFTCNSLQKLFPTRDWSALSEQLLSCHLHVFPGEGERNQLRQCLATRSAQLVDRCPEHGLADQDSHVGAQREHLDRLSSTDPIPPPSGQSSAGLQFACTHYQYQLAPPEGSRDNRYFKNHHCALCNAANFTNYPCGALQKPTSSAINHARERLPRESDYKFVVKLQPGKQAQYSFPQDNRKYSSEITCDPESVYSIFTDSCKKLRCPSGFVPFENSCLVDLINFACTDHRLYLAPPNSFNFLGNSTLSVSGASGYSYIVESGNLAVNNNNLVLCANNSVLAMLQSNRQTHSTSFVDFVFVIFGFLSVGCLLAAMTMVVISKRKNSLTLIGFNILLTLFFENVAMFPRVLLAGPAAPGGKACVLSAIVDHYCWVVLFSWVCCFCYEEMRCQKYTGSQLCHRPQTWLYVILCWLSPIVLVMINTVMHFLQFNWLEQIYGGQSCSVSNVAIFLFSSVLPTSILITLSVFFLIIALYKHQPPSPLWGVETAEFHRRWLFSALLLLFLTGMCWCLHLLYNIVQMRYAYHACNFALQLQSVLFAANMMYFTRLERIAELNQQKRWQEIIAKQSSYHNTLQKQMQRLLDSSDLTQSPANQPTIRLDCKTSPRGEFTREFTLNRDVCMAKRSFGGTLRAATLGPYSAPPVVDGGEENNNLRTMRRLASSPMGRIAEQRSRARGSVTEITSEHNGNSSDTEDLPPPVLPIEGRNAEDKAGSPSSSACSSINHRMEGECKNRDATCQEVGLVVELSDQPDAKIGFSE